MWSRATSLWGSRGPNADARISVNTAGRYQAFARSWYSPRSCALLPRIAKCYHDLGSERDPNSRAHKQCYAGDDVMQVAWAFVPIAPSGPSSHDPCRCPHAQKNGSGIDQNNQKGHAAETKAVGRHIASSALLPQMMLSGDTAIPIRIFCDRLLSHAAFRYQAKARTRAASMRCWHIASVRSPLNFLVRNQAIADGRHPYFSGASFGLLPFASPRLPRACLNRGPKSG